MKFWADVNFKVYNKYSISEIQIYNIFREKSDFAAYICSSPFEFFTFIFFADYRPKIKNIPNNETQNTLNSE